MSKEIMPNAGQRQRRLRQDLRRLPRAAQERPGGCRRHQHPGPLALRTGCRRGAGRQRYLCAEAALDDPRRRPRGERHRSGRKRAFQIGSQQRSDSPWPQFRRACELVRNGRIGKLHTVKVGLPTDPSGGNPQEQPVPPNLNYEMWLGCTPQAPYNEDRVHPQNSLKDRPGWLRIDSYCLGMITGWGSHHMDITHWGMDTELTGPIEAEGRAEFPKEGLWNVHGPYHIEMKYANGATVIIDNKFENGVRFEGSEGWIFVSRGSARATASDPVTGNSKALAASSPAILKSEIGPKEIHLHKSSDHHLDWLNSIRTRQRAATTPEIAHRSTSACEIAWITMKLGRKVRWDPVKEVFLGDDEANAMRSRPQRAPYGIDRLLKKS